MLESGIKHHNPNPPFRPYILISVSVKARSCCKVSHHESKLQYKVNHRDDLKVKIHSKGSFESKDFVPRQVLVKVKLHY